MLMQWGQFWNYWYANAYVVELNFKTLQSADISIVLNFQTRFCISCKGSLFCVLFINDNMQNKA